MFEDGSNVEFGGFFRFELLEEFGFEILDFLDEVFFYLKSKDFN